MELVATSGAELVVVVVVVVVRVATVLVDAVVGSVREAAEDVAAEGKAVLLKKLHSLNKLLSVDD